MNFKKKLASKPTSPVKYPHATFVHSEAGYFFIKDDSKRYRLLSKRVVDSWRPHRVVETTEAALKNYKVAAKMQFRNGSLIWNLSDGKIYLIEHGKRRWLKNPDWFYVLGLDPSDLRWNIERVQHVSEDEINLHEEGEPLN